MSAGFLVGGGAILGAYYADSLPFRSGVNETARAAALLASAWAKGGLDESSPQPVSVKRGPQGVLSPDSAEAAWVATADGSALGSCAVPGGSDAVVRATSSGELELLTDGRPEDPKTLRTDLWSAPPENGREPPLRRPPGLACADLVDAPADPELGRNELVLVEPAARGEEPLVQVLDRHGKALAELQPNVKTGQDVSVAAAASHGDGRLAVATPDGQVQVFEVRDSSQGTEFRRLRTLQPFPDFEQRPNVALGQLDGDRAVELAVAPGVAPLAPATVQIYDGETWQRQGTIQPKLKDHTDAVGYFHAENPALGSSVQDVKGFTNTAHFAQPQDVRKVERANLAPILDVHLSDDEALWERQLRKAKRQLPKGYDTSSLTVYVKDEAEFNNWDTAKQSRAIDLVKQERHFPDATTVINYLRPVTPPPENLDVVAVNAYPNALLSRDHPEIALQLVEEKIEAAAAYGKPVMVIVPSFRDGRDCSWTNCWKRYFIQMPSPDVVRGYIQTALEEKDVVSVLYFLYGSTPPGAEKHIEGAAEHPEILKVHKQGARAIQAGNGGLVLDIADTGGTPRREELVLGQPAVAGNYPTAAVFDGRGRQLQPEAAVVGAAPGFTDVAAIKPTP